MNEQTSESEEVDRKWMREALSLARKAASLGEVPIGSVVICEGEVVGRGHNLRESLQSPLAHAEMIALHEASQNIGSWRLEDCSIYVTLEPCPMCAGAIVNSRIAKCIYGASDPKAGAVNTLFQLLGDPRLNHQTLVEAGCLYHSCAELLSGFFRSIRAGEGVPKPKRMHHHPFSVDF